MRAAHRRAPTRTGAPAPGGGSAACALMGRFCAAREQRESGVGCTYLGLAYERGRGVAQDYSKAKDLYERGCSSQIGDACTHLARFYQLGIATDREGNVYVGGLPNGEHMTNGRYVHGLKGCVHHLQIQNSGLINFQRSALSAMNVVPCSRYC